MRLLLIILSILIFSTSANASCDITPRFSYKTSGLTVSFKNKTVGEYEKVKWEFGDGSTSEELHPSHAYEGKGKYQFTLTVYGKDGCESTFEGKVYVFDTKRRILVNEVRDKVKEEKTTVEDVTTIAKNEVELPNTETTDNLSSVGSYPNPFEDVTIITFNLAAQDEVIVSVFDISGQLVREVANQKMMEGTHSFRFERGDLTAGVYLLQVTTMSTSKTHKMMIQ